MADLNDMAASMVGSIGTPGDTLNRLQEMVGEEREKAMARARVASSNFSTTDLAAREAEQDILAAQALDEFLAGNVSIKSEPLALAHYDSEAIEILTPLKRPEKSTHKGGKS